MPDDQVLTRRGAVGGDGEGVQGVQQLADRDRGRSGRTGALIGPGVEHDQVLAGGTDGVQEELAVLAAPVPLPDPGLAQQDVVAGPGSRSRERRLVQAEQADHPVRDGAHRLQGTDGQRSGAEARPRRPAGQSTGQQRAQVAQAQLGVPVPVCRGGHVDEHPAGLDRLPPLIGTGLGEQVQHPLQGGQPGAEGASARELAEQRLKPVDELGEPSDQFRVDAVDVVQRQGGPQPADVLVLGHRDPEQDPVQPRPPGAVEDLGKSEVGPPSRVLAPPHPGGERPGPDPVQVVRAEAEPLPYRGTARQIQHRARLDPAGRQVQHLGQQGQLGVGLAHRAVREPDRELLTGVGRRRPGSDRRTEGTGDQRCVGLDVRAHHQDVAQLQRGVVGQQAQDDLAQHLHLAGAAVTGVDLDAAITGSQPVGDLAVQRIVLGQRAVQCLQQARCGAVPRAGHRPLIPR